MQIVFFYWPFWIYRFIELLRKYLMAFQTITEVFRNFGEDGRYEYHTILRNSKTVYLGLGYVIY